ncbi:hypothetical protein BBJ28_00024994, partial [Nothophytophthora sp. Chile5]
MAPQKVPSTGRFVRVGSPRYQEWQQLIFENTPSREFRRRQELKDRLYEASLPPAVPKPSYPTPTRILARPSQSQTPAEHGLSDPALNGDVRGEEEVIKPMDGPCPTEETPREGEADANMAQSTDEWDWMEAFGVGELANENLPDLGRDLHAVPPPWASAADGPSEPRLGACAMVSDAEPVTLSPRGLVEARSCSADEAANHEPEGIGDSISASTSTEEARAELRTLFPSSHPDLLASAESQNSSVRLALVFNAL